MFNIQRESHLILKWAKMLKECRAWHTRIYKLLRRYLNNINLFSRKKSIKVVKLELILCFQAINYHKLVSVRKNLIICRSKSKIIWKKDLMRLRKILLNQAQASVKTWVLKILKKLVAWIKKSKMGH